VPYEHFPGADTTFNYIGFGWGDKGFYIETPTWDDLTLTTALRSLFLPTEAAMHTEYFLGEPRIYIWREQLIITEEQYSRLIKYVKEHFDERPDGSYDLIEGAAYGRTDNFYEAHGRYTALNTSNNWTNRGLKRMGVRAATWAPIDRTIQFQLRIANRRAERMRKE
jgi:uncharacterized protein (TIGR02117 family)